MGVEWDVSGLELERRSDVTRSPRLGHRRGCSEQNRGFSLFGLLNVAVCSCEGAEGETAVRDELGGLEASAGRHGVLGWTGGWCCLFG